MRVLVAGGAGFIGNRMCRRLLERGAEVVCVDNLLTGAFENIEGLLDHRGFSFVEADITLQLPDTGRLDAVVNLASPASPVDFGPLALEILDVGSRGTANLLELARLHSARYLHASTSEVYGEPLVHPQPETYWGNVNPIGVRSVYDEAKRFAEALTFAYHRRHGLQVRVARIFNTYGPGMRPDDGRIVSTFVIQALSDEPITIHGDGSQTRSFCFVDDEVEGLLALLASDITGPVNVGSDDERSVLDVAHLVRELSRSKSEIVFVDRPSDDPSRRRPDLTLARTELGWWPRTNLEVGIEQTVDYFRSKLTAAQVHG
ncbi:MAG: SDR family oxidoreductase [Acidimicrobiaceae bacterium]|nr:SDR family oxidoreductase [Acidimicrobiaceae bacterium]